MADPAFALRARTARPINKSGNFTSVARTWNRGHWKPQGRTRSHRQVATQICSAFRNWKYETRILVLFTQGLGVRFAVGIEGFLSALLPRRFEFGRRDVPVRPAFFSDSA
jgi:hypothetical protein